MESLRQLFVTLGLDWDQAGFAQALTASNMLEGAAKALVNGFKMLASQLASSITETTKYGSTINDARLRTGETAETLQELGHAAKLSGSDQATMFSVLTKLAGTMSNAAGGSKEAAAGFAALGVKVTDANGKLKPVGVVFNELTARLGEIENPTERAGKAFDVFSRQAQGLLPLFAEGEKGLEAMRSQYHDLGIAMSDEAVTAADAFGDSLDTLHALLESFRGEIGTPLIAALQPVVDAFFEWVKANRALISSRLANFAQALIGAFKFLWRVMQALVSVAEAVAYWWKLIATVVGSFLIAKFVLLNVALLETLVAWGLNTAAAIAYGAASLAAAGKAAIAWLAAAAPVILMTAALVAAVLVAEDIYGFFTGADSVLGSLGRKWAAFLETWLTNTDGDGWLMVAFKAIVWTLTDIEGRLFPAVKEAWAEVTTFMEAAADRAAAAMRNAFQTVLNVARLIPGVSTAMAISSAAGFDFPGGAAGPAPSAESGNAAARAKGRGHVSPHFQANINLHQQPGQSNEGLGVMLEQRLDDWWNVKIRETVGTSGGE